MEKGFADPPSLHPVATHRRTGVYDDGGDTYLITVHGDRRERHPNHTPHTATPPTGYKQASGCDITNYLRGSQGEPTLQLVARRGDRLDLPRPPTEHRFRTPPVYDVLLRSLLLYLRRYLYFPMRPVRLYIMPAHRASG